jgi:hypothetical protein
VSTGLGERSASLEVREPIAAGKTGHDRTVVQRQIEGTDRQIDRLVYELYGLSDEEIGVVEETTAGREGARRE